MVHGQAAGFLSGGGFGGSHRVCDTLREAAAAAAAERFRTQNHRPGALSWQYDAAYVYAAFLSVYHMDLQQVEQMHWHLFLGLFDALPDETPIKQRMGYRSVNLAEIKDKNERRRIRKIQDRIRIPQPELDGYQCGAFFG